MKPIIVHQFNLNLLAWVEAGKGVVEDLHVEALLLTDVVVATRTPMLPLSHLAATPLLPHTFSVVKTFGANSIRFKSKVSVVT